MLFRSYVISITGSYDFAFVIAGVLLLTGIVITLTMTHRPITHAATRDALCRDVA